MTELSVVGKVIPRVDALEKVTGKAKFTSDFKMPGMLYGKIVKSRYPHAKILRIETTKAERVSGVKTIVLPEDAPNVRFGYGLCDGFILPRDNIVRCIGQPVAVVVADTLESAEEAVDLVEVDYEELPAVFDAEEALSADPPALVHPEMSEGFFSRMFPFSFDPSMPNCCQHFKVRQGDVNRGFDQSDYVVENRFSTARVSHCSLEPRVVDAWVEGDDTLTMRTTAQTPNGIQTNFAMLYGVSPTKVRVVVPYVGGGFGGKIGNDTMLEPLAMLAAIKSGKPVRLMHTREEEFVGGRHRGDTITYIKDGVKRDGTLVAREMRVILNVGLKADVAHIVARNMAFGTVGTYRIPNFKLDTYGVYTNNPPTGAFRGFGSPEVIWSIEQQMDILAERLGIDSVEIRKRNILREGDKDVCGQTTVAIGVGNCLDRVAEWIGWDAKPVEEQGPWKKGKGIAIGNKYTVSIPASATVKVHSDGTVEVRHGSVEMGTGLNTVLAQIAAEEFGIPVHRIKVVHGDTAICPSDHGPVSSRSTFFTGNAVRLACQDAKMRILEMASMKLGTQAENLTTKEGKAFVTKEPDKFVSISDLFAFGMPLKGSEVIGTASFSVPTVPEDPKTGQSERIVAYFSHFAHAVECAVNIETGEVRVLKIVGAADMGTPINPKMAEGQIEGGFLQGIGTSIFEQIVLEKGMVANPSFADYRIPTAAEMPPNDKTKAIIEFVPHPEGPSGAKGLGEGVIVAIAPAIANAVYNAVGLRVRDLPISAEKVLKQLKESGYKGKA
jgi:CO/xanthine dehydrogenase Mo-binding subunit